jgi:uncharacterized delta-60 repeat protein
MKRIFTLLFVATYAMHGHAQTCNPLDQSFGVAGKVTGIINNAYLYSRNIIVQPDNKIIQLGTTVVSGTYRFTVLRYNANGTIDGGFGSNGTVVTAIGQSDEPEHGALQNDGKIVLVGRTYNANWHSDVALVRYNADGSLDNGFGVGGKVIRALGPNNNSANAVAVQPDGKIIVAGSIEGNCFTDCYWNSFCSPAFGVARFNSNGSIDSTFGRNGIVTTNVGPVDAGIASSIILQPDGKIVVAGRSLYDYSCDYYGGWYYSSAFAMVRYDPNGSRDSSFGKNGIVYDSLSLLDASDVVMQPSGKIIVAGPDRNGGSVARQFNGDGSLDNGFGRQGKVLISYGSVNSLAVLPNGKIVMAGRIYWERKENFQIIRLNNDGSFDSSFNASGRVMFHPGVPGSSDFATGIALQGEHLVVGGVSNSYLNNSSIYSMLVTRLLDSIAGLSVVVTPRGTLTPCPGEAVRLVSSESGTIQWFVDGTAINGANDTVYTTSADGQYSVLVQNSKGCGQSPPVTVDVNGLPVVITPASAPTICLGDSVKLISSENGTLQWFKNGSTLAGATDTVYIAKLAGSYTVSVKNAKGCGISTPANVIVNADKPIVNWNGAQSKLSTQTGFYGYQWYLNGNPIAGANGSFFQPVQTGVYKVIIADYTCNNISDEFNLDCGLIAVPKPFITWNVTQLNTAATYAGYQWSLNGNTIAGANSNSYRPTQAGIYKVAVTGNLGCINTSDEFNFNCTSFGPPKPPINWNNGYYFTTTTGYAHYQWLLNGSAIAGSDSDRHKPAQTGLYKVIVTDIVGCSNTSDSFNLVVLGVADITIGDAKLRCYPNPVRTVLNVDVTNVRSNKLHAELYDVTGRFIKKQLLNQNNNQLPVQGLATGLYQLVIFNGREKTVLKVMVIK